MLYFFTGDERCIFVIPIPINQSLIILRLFYLKKNKIIPIHYLVIYLICKNDSCLMNYLNFEMLKRILLLKATHLQNNG